MNNIKTRTAKSLKELRATLELQQWEVGQNMKGKSRLSHPSQARSIISAENGNSNTGISNLEKIAQATGHDADIIFYTSKPDRFDIKYKEMFSDTRKGVLGLYGFAVDDFIGFCGKRYGMNIFHDMASKGIEPYEGQIKQYLQSKGYSLNVFYHSPQKIWLWNIPGNQVFQSCASEEFALCAGLLQGLSLINKDLQLMKPEKI